MCPTQNVRTTLSLVRGDQGFVAFEFFFVPSFAVAAIASPHVIKKEKKKRKGETEEETETEVEEEMEVRD